MSSSEFIIFYIWQSDVPARCNRTLIEDALEEAAKEIANDATVQAAPRPVSGRVQASASGPLIVPAS